MIVIDTSALLAIALKEDRADTCSKALQLQTAVCISAGTLAETLIVAGRRGAQDAVNIILDGLDCEVVPVTATGAREAAEAHRRWGKGVHPARLNLGDCFAYALAKSRGLPLLYIGNDFGLADIVSVIA